jgi:hypothetical protein
MTHVRHGDDAARLRPADDEPARLFRAADPGRTAAACDVPTPGGPVEVGVALLFGSERFGMRNEDVYRCHVACASRPTRTSAR